MVFVHAKIGELKVKDLSQKLHGISGFIFHLQLCEGQQLKHQILLKSHTEWVTLCQCSVNIMFTPVQTGRVSRWCFKYLFCASTKEREAEMDHSDVSIWSARRHRASQRERRWVESFRNVMNQCKPFNPLIHYFVFSPQIYPRFSASKATRPKNMMS